MEGLQILVFVLKFCSTVGAALTIMWAVVSLHEISESLKTLCARFNAGSFTQVNMPPIADDDQGEFAAKMAAAMREARKGGGE